MNQKEPNQNNEILKMQGIAKAFPGVQALNNVNFTLRSGEIHALMGENGAGKSTLIKVLTGVYPMDSGEVSLKGRTVVIRSPLEAQKLGISTVYQEVNLCPNLTVAENLFLGREPRKRGFIDWKKINQLTKEVLDSFNIQVAATAQLDSCSIAIQQMIAIARAVNTNCQVLILDEPTSSLDSDEVKKMFVLMRQLKAQGLGIIFVTHFLEQAYEICDSITILRNGELVGEYKLAELSRLELVAKMLGKEFDDLSNLNKDEIKRDKNNNSEVPYVEAKDLSSGRNKVAPFSLKLYKGEVVGLSGLLGSGRSELVRSLYGADRVMQGKLLINGNETKIKSPLVAMEKGMAYLPEDRKADGIIADLSVKENIIIALQAKQGLLKRLSYKEMQEYADKYIELLDIKTADRETPIKSLSGGNQQKVILARWLLTNPQFLILDEPTRGIDIGTKTEIQKLILKLAQEGKSIAFISSEMEEMLRTCSRMVVMLDHHKIKELTGNELNQETIMKTIASGGSKNA